MTITPLPATPSDQDLEPGTVVGEYVVDRKLGEGGFGAVFEAHHPVIDKVVAIKVLSRRFSVEPEVTARFVAEAKAVNKIRHRNIIDIFSFGQLEDGRHYYVMEHLEGETLDDMLARRKQVPLAEALPILRGVARALDAAHAKGVAHRDLKPGNIYISRDEEGAVFPKLLDFGIAKLMHVEPAEQVHSTRTGIPMGTPLFMSPEQCRGRDVDHRTDYYAFGVVMYLMLTGRYPLDGEDYMTILMKQMDEEPPPPTSIVPELPAAVDEVIGWLMRKAATDRPPSLAAAMRALEEGGIQAASLTPVPGAPIDVTPQALSPITIGVASTGDALGAVRPRPWRWIALAVVTMVIGGVAFVVISNRGTTPTTEAPAPVTSPTAPPVRSPPVRDPAPPPPPTVEPAPPPPPVVARPDQKVPPSPPPRPRKPPATVVKPAGSATPTGSNTARPDSHGIEDPFKK